MNRATTQLFRTSVLLVVLCVFFCAAAEERKLVMGEHGRIYISSDSGTTWHSRATNRHWRAIACSADGRKLVALDGGPRKSAGGKVYTSADFGETWAAQWKAKRWISVASSADGERLIAGTYGEGFYTSSDSGVTWIQHAEGSKAYWSAVGISVDGRKLVAMPWGSANWISSDFGKTWTRGNTNLHWSSVACSADATKLVAAVQCDGIYTSYDSGATWMKRKEFLGANSAASSADGSKLFIAGDRRVFVSEDAGLTWAARSYTTGSEYIATSADATKVIAAGTPGAIYVSDHQCKSWKQSKLRGNWTALAISADGIWMAGITYASEPPEPVFSLPEVKRDEAFTWQFTGRTPGNVEYKFAVFPIPARDGWNSTSAPTPALTENEAIRRAKEFLQKVPLEKEFVAWEMSGVNLLPHIDADGNEYRLYVVHFNATSPSAQTSDGPDISVPVRMDGTIPEAVVVVKI